MRANFVMSGMAAGIRRNLGMTIALILSTSIALAFVGASILANKEITKFKQKYESKINVSIYLCSMNNPQPPCTAPTTTAQQNALQLELAADPAVKSAKYVSPEEAFQNAKATLAPDVAEFLKLGDVPASYTIKLRDLQHDYDAFQAKYAKAPGVGQVQNQVDSFNALLDILNGARLASVVVAFVVLIASILLIANTIQVAAAQRREETGIMRLVGASRLMTELPFMLESMVAAAVGGLIAFVMVWLGKHYVLNGIFHGQTARGVIPDLNINDVLVASGIGLAGGVVLAAVTAFATLRLLVKL
jgi:cell division transport system permease protein